MNGKIPVAEKDLRISHINSIIEKWVADGMTKQEAIQVFREVNGLCVICGANKSVWKELFSENHNCKEVVKK